MASSRETAVLTVAAIRRAEDGTTKVLFNERQAIFTLAETDARAALLEGLRSGHERGGPLKAVVDTKRGVVHRIAEPSRKDLAIFEETRTLLERPDKVVSLDVAKIDPTKFNIVDHYLKFRCFKLCDRVVPSYKKAKEIFDYCAAQSCHLPGPTTETPCIPFQYVRDGCYARAHKMRQIIEGKYGYCSEKVFSFAIDEAGTNYTLSVRAGKWGGCCVNWWYHVAPLVRVRVKILTWELTLAMVIDPSMFDKPVLLSTWLSAQENPSCAGSAIPKVTKYSIQPSSAYTPANGQGTQFATDPNYTATNQTLIGYSNLTTC
jgi:hypothetical protein